MKALKTALKTLDVKKATAEYITADRILVRVNGEYFGIYDTEKQTFID